MCMRMRGQPRHTPPAIVAQHNMAAGSSGGNCKFPKVTLKLALVLVSGRVVVPGSDETDSGEDQLLLQ